mmetsp:Transcript_55065/g.101938  ORF Transcript_55065/g.101938 Transcript_55065/m.101938 type:complete len:169 (-) Transcript_55065:68-574(-)
MVHSIKTFQEAPVRRKQRALRILYVAAAMACACPFGATFFGGEPAEPTGYRLRVCGDCLKRKAGNGYNPRPVLDKLREEAVEAGWDAADVEVGKCVGGCDFGPNVRLVKGELALPVVVDGMTEDEEQTKAFLGCETELATQRAFGLTLRHMKEKPATDDNKDDLLNQL